MITYVSQSRFELLQDLCDKLEMREPSLPPSNGGTQSSNASQGVSAIWDELEFFQALLSSPDEEVKTLLAKYVDRNIIDRLDSDVSCRPSC